MIINHQEAWNVIISPPGQKHFENTIEANLIDDLRSSQINCNLIIRNTSDGVDSVSNSVRNLYSRNTSKSNSTTTINSHGSDVEVANSKEEYSNTNNDKKESNNSNSSSRTNDRRSARSNSVFYVSVE